MASRKKRPAPRIADPIGEALREQAQRRTESDARWWWGRLTHANGERDTSKYDEGESAYYGKIFDDATLLKARQNREFVMECNKHLSTIRAQRQRIIPRIPYHRMEALQKLDDLDSQRRETAEQTLNFYFRAPRTDYASRMKQMHLLGELGFCTTETYFNPDRGIDPEENKREETVKIEVEENPDTGEIRAVTDGGPPLLDDQGNMIRRGKEVILDTRNPLEYFGTQTYHWRDVLVDPETTDDAYTMRWAATRFCIPYLAAMKNPVFSRVRDRLKSAAQTVVRQEKKSVIRKAPQSAGYGRAPVSQDGGFDLDPEDALRTWGWRIWDAENRQTVYLVDGISDVVAGKFAYPGWIDFMPLRFLRFEPKIGQFYPQTASQHALPYLRGYAIFMGTLVNHLKRFKRKYGHTPNAFGKEEAADKFLDPKDGMLQELQSKDSLWAIEDAFLDPSIYRMIAYFEQNYLQIMGSAAEFLGVPGADSATQASIIDRRGVGQEDEKRNIFIDHLQQVSDLQLANFQCNLPRDIAIRIDEKNGPSWKQVKRADLGGLGLYKTRIDISEMTPFSTGSHFQDLLGFLQLFGPEAMMVDGFAKELTKSGLMHDQDIAQELTELATIKMAMQLAQGKQNASTNGRPPAKGGYKPTGQGQEAGNTTAGRSAGRENRQDQVGPTLIGPGNTPVSGGAQ